MDVFALRTHLIRDYAAYLASFVWLDPRQCVDSVDRELNAGPLWLGASRPIMRRLGLATRQVPSATAQRE